MLSGPNKGVSSAISSTFTFRTQFSTSSCLSSSKETSAIKNLSNSLRFQKQSTTLFVEPPNRHGQRGIAASHQLHGLNGLPGGSGGEGLATIRQGWGTVPALGGCQFGFDRGERGTAGGA